MLIFAGHASEWEDSGVVLFFWQWTQNLLTNSQAHWIKFGMKRQGNNFVRLCLPSISAISKEAGGQSTPKSSFSSKFFLSETTGPNALKVVWRLLEHVRLCSTWQYRPDKMVQETSFHSGNKQDWLLSVRFGPKSLSSMSSKSSIERLPVIWIRSSKGL